MATFRLAKRYAKGLMIYTDESNQTDLVCKELKDLRKSLKQNRELKVFLNSPVLDSKKKRTIAKEIFKAFSQPVQTFVQLVIEHRRESSLDEIADQFIYQYNHNHSIHKARIKSAAALNETQIEKIITKAKETFKGDWEYEVENTVDPSLIGGFVLQVEDKQINASVRNKLNQLRTEFSQNEYVPKI